MDGLVSGGIVQQLDGGMDGELDEWMVWQLGDKGTDIKWRNV